MKSIEMLDEDVGLWHLLIWHRESPAEAETSLRSWMDEFIAKGLAEPEGNILSRFSMHLLLPCDYIPQPVIDAVVAVIPTDRFCQHEHAAELFNPFTLEDKLFTDSQKVELLGALVSAYNRMTHWYTQFCVTELLGDTFPEVGTFKFARRLDLEATGYGRRFIPHVFEHFIKDCPEESIRRESLARLLELEEDPDEAVRGEVEESFHRLGGKLMTRRNIGDPRPSRHDA